MTFAQHWSPYTPEKETPWDLRRVVHLHRRAGFAATWDELQRDLADGPQASVDRLLQGAANAHAPADFDRIAGLLADSALAAGEVNRLKAWWFYRVLFGPDALGEKLTLLWHDHFATGFAKVKDIALMHGQNEAFRKHARGPFAQLLGESVRQPALLYYLDAPTNRKGHPNENLGRELMELFTLGVGHYTEADVKEAARALTGWTVEGGKFAESSPRHDAGTKTILGKKGQWTGDDLLKMLLDHPATAERVALKLCQQLLGEKALTREAVGSLADGLREQHLDLGWAVGVILKSTLFFSDDNIRSRVLGPVEYVAGTVRALDMFEPAPSTLALADWSARIGQDLFDPPNVGGWPTGRAWLHPRAMIVRANFAAALLEGPNAGRPAPYDAARLPMKHGLGSDSGAVLTFHHRLLFGTEPTDEMRKRCSGLDGRKIVALLLASPEAQLG
jgi:uncharacterized protein (DUF1800 family)